MGAEASGLGDIKNYSRLVLRYAPPGETMETLSDTGGAYQLYTNGCFVLSR